MTLHLLEKTSKGLLHHYLCPCSNPDMVIEEDGWILPKIGEGKYL